MNNHEQVDSLERILTSTVISMVKEYGQIQKELVMQVSQVHERFIDKMITVREKDEKVSTTQKRKRKCEASKEKGKRHKTNSDLYNIYIYLIGMANKKKKVSNPKDHLQLLMCDDGGDIIPITVPWTKVPLFLQQKLTIENNNILKVCESDLEDTELQLFTPNEVKQFKTFISVHLGVFLANESTDNYASFGIIDPLQIWSPCTIKAILYYDHVR